MEIKDYIKNIEGAERRYFESEVRAKSIPSNDGNADDVLKTVDGYAAKFNSITVIGFYWPYEEEIATGAFDDILNDDVRCLFNHDPNYILARSNKSKGTLKLSIDEVGLKYEYDSPDRSFADDLLDAIDKGDVSQSSFAFKIKEEKWTVGDSSKGILDKRTILKFEKLYDVSPVTYPAYADTEVAARSLTAFQEKNKPEQRSDNHKELNAFDAQIIINSNL